MNKPIGKEYEKIQCPYVASHLIDRCRIQVHLNRCRNSHKHFPLADCPFNATHHLRKPELEWHVQNCEDRKSFESFKYTDATTTRPAVPPIVMPEVEQTENWDDDPDVAPYKPEEYAANASVLRLCQNRPPLVRKNFRKAEHLRLTRLED